MIIICKNVVFDPFSPLLFYKKHLEYIKSSTPQITEQINQTTYFESGINSLGFNPTHSLYA